MRRCSALHLFICDSDSAGRVCRPVCVSHHLQSVSTWLQRVHHRSVEIAALQIPPVVLRGQHVKRIRLDVCSIPPEVNAEADMPRGGPFAQAPFKVFSRSHHSGAVMKNK